MFFEEDSILILPTVESEIHRAIVNIWLQLRFRHERLDNRMFKSSVQMIFDECVNRYSIRPLVPRRIEVRGYLASRGLSDNRMSVVRSSCFALNTYNVPWLYVDASIRHEGVVNGNKVRGTRKNSDTIQIFVSRYLSKSRKAYSFRNEANALEARVMTIS